MKPRVAWEQASHGGRRTQAVSLASYAQRSLRDRVRGLHRRVAVSIQPGLGRKVRGLICETRGAPAQISRARLAKPCGDIDNSKGSARSQTRLGEM